MAICVRELRPPDERVLHRVAPGVFDRQVRPEWARAFLCDPSHRLVVATDEETVVGMISAVVFLHPDKPPQLWINEIGVATTHQRRGIGRQLVDTMLDVGRSAGCISAWLGSEPENLLAHELYEKAGGTASPCLLFTFELGVQQPATADDAGAR